MGVFYNVIHSVMYTIALRALCKLSQGTPAHGSKILMFLGEREHTHQKDRKIYMACVSHRHICVIILHITSTEAVD